MTQELTPEVVPDADVRAATHETLEDYTLRFAPRSYRKWSTRVVAISALGGIAYLADFAIGADIGISSRRSPSSSSPSRARSWRRASIWA